MDDLVETLKVNLKRLGRPYSYFSYNYVVKVTFMHFEYSTDTCYLPSLEVQATLTSKT